MSIEMDAPFATNDNTDSVIPGYSPIREVFQSGDIWSRDILSVEDRLIAILSALVLKQCLPMLEEKVRTALDNGITPRAISEIILQAGLYGGLPVVEAASVRVGDVYLQREVKPDEQLLPPEDEDSLNKAALDYQQTLHGERRASGHADPDELYTAELYDITTRYGYGLVWRRPGLSLRHRLIVALACFATLGNVDSFFIKFAHSATEHGFTAAEIREVVIQTAPYIGFPRALRTLTLMKQIISC